MAVYPLSLRLRQQAGRLKHTGSESVNASEAGRGLSASELPGRAQAELRLQKFKSLT